MIQFVKLVLNKTTLFIILLMVIALLFLWATLERSGRIEAEEERNEARQVANHHKEATLFYVNQYNREVAKSKQRTISAGNFKSLQNTEDFKFTKQFKVKPAQVVSGDQISAHVDESKIPLFQVDSVECDSVFLWKLKDEFNDIEAYVIDSPKVKIGVPIDIIETWERKRPWLWIFSKKEYFRQATSPNTLIKIDSISSFTIRKK